VAGVFLGAKVEGELGGGPVRLTRDVRTPATGERVPPGPPGLVILLRKSHGTPMLRWAMGKTRFMVTSDIAYIGTVNHEKSLIKILTKYNPLYYNPKYWYLDGPWKKRDLWLVTGDMLPPNYIPMK